MASLYAWHSAFGIARALTDWHRGRKDYADVHLEKGRSVILVPDGVQNRAVKEQYLTSSSESGLACATKLFLMDIARYA